jgi:hypothetical protein
MEPLIQVFTLVGSLKKKKILATQEDCSLKPSPGREKKITKKGRVTQVLRVPT